MNLAEELREESIRVKAERELKSLQLVENQRLERERAQQRASEYIESDFAQCVAKCKAAAKRGDRIVQLLSSEYRGGGSDYDHYNHGDIKILLTNKGISVKTEYVPPHTSIDSFSDRAGYHTLIASW